MCRCFERSASVQRDMFSSGQELAETLDEFYDSPSPLQPTCNMFKESYGYLNSQVCPVHASTRKVYSSCFLDSEYAYYHKKALAIRIYSIVLFTPAQECHGYVCSLVRTAHDDIRMLQACVFSLMKSSRQKKIAMCTCVLRYCSVCATLVK